MKIESIRIQKFRSIDDSSLRMKQVIAIVGANNTGKSHFLRALNAFFNFDKEKQFFSNHDHMYSANSRPKITITFSEIHSDLISESDLVENKLTISFLYRWDRNRPSYEIITGTGPISLESDRFRQILSTFKFIYIPISRDYRGTFSRDTGIVHDFLKDLFDRQTARRDTIQPIFQQVHAKLKSTILKTAIKKIKNLYPFNRENDFELYIKDENTFECIIQNVTLILKENNSENDIRNCGSGIQSAVYLAMALAAAVEDNIEYLVGIEEPELNMHPQAQRELIETLKDSCKYPRSQFILTSHSSVIIDKLGHDAIALCRKNAGRTRDIVTSITQIGEDFWTKYGLEECKYYNFFNFKNSDFFYSKYLVLTESPIDCNIFIELLKRYDIDPDKNDITFIPAGGESSLKYPYSLATELKIPFVCIVDRDTFQSYLNDKRDDSLSTDGFPLYKSEIKNSAFWESAFVGREKTQLQSNLQPNVSYKNLSEFLMQKKIITMMYSLEVDLIFTPELREKYYLACSIPASDQSPRELLVNKCKMIKRLDIMLNVLHDVHLINLPRSYKKVIRTIREMISNY